ncbi:protein kinase domain-containing protein [Egbenema bharatensis]|uniref:protein kinase domain-containing protein n=1 Tax=Egbenema bharatensis TaxID=3463334 RepID=UPI003A8BAE11
MNFLRFLQSSSTELLGGRYKLIEQLGAGGFGETFLAEDCHLPGHPRCVIKRLKPQVSSMGGLKTAKRLFDTEANVLYLLGEHDQIPRLLAHFEHNEEFYLAQELIEGQPLDRELVKDQPWPEEQVVAFLYDLLHVLTFVHQQGVIHRDIKPQNLIRRRHDNRIVLIDFGAVKQASIQLADPNSGPTRTISIGTQGYMPNEQVAGSPRFSSDLYAVGKIAIQALTGVSPRHLQEDPHTGEVMWRHLAPQASAELVEFLETMVRYDFRARYPTAIEALSQLKQLPVQPSAAAVLPSNPVCDTPDRPPLRHKSPPNADPLEANHPLVVNQLAVNQTIAATDPFSQVAPTSASAISTTAIWQSGAESSAPPLEELEIPDATAVETAVESDISEPPIPAEVPQAKVTTEATAASQVATQAVIPAPRPQTASGLTSDRLERTAWRYLLIPMTGIAAIGLLIALFRPAPIAPPPPEAAVTDSSTPDPQAPPASPSPDPAAQMAALLTQANDLREARQFLQALEQYDRAIALDNSNPEAQWGRCYSLNRLNRLDEAIVACDAALAVKPDYPEALWSKGYALDLQNNPAAALPFYEQAIALKPDFAEAWSNKGTALFYLSRPEESLAALNKATELDPTLAEAWNNRGAVLWNLRRFDEAAQSVDRALQLQPDHQDALSLREQMRQRLGR